MKPSIRWSHLALAWILAVLTATGVAYAVIPSGDGTIHACFKKSGGALRVIDAATGACGSNEISLSWNQAGQPGAPGISGYEIVSEVRELGAIGGHFGGLLAFCPAGKSVLGGGAAIQTDNGGVSSAWQIVASAPSGDGTGWFAVGNVTSNSERDELLFTTYAICAVVES